MSKTAFIFPGQGSQLVGMGKDLAEVNDHAARVFNQANEILGFDLSGICFEGPPERLASTDIQQPAILVTSAALWAALTEGGTQDLPFDATAGLSLGEYTALFVAGSLQFSDAVRLVHNRGRFMQEAAEAVPSGMVSIMGLPADEVDELCRQAAEGEVLAPANYNCPGQIVISGAKSACARAVELVDQSGNGRAVALNVAGAFHSDLMKPAAEKLKAELDHTDFAPPRVPVIANVDVSIHGSADQMRDLLYRQVFSPVRWQASIEHLAQDGIERFVEVGPGRVLTGLMRKIDRKKTAVNVSTAESLEQFVADESSRSTH